MALSDDLSSTQLALTRYILPTLFLFGIIGNLLNILVFAQKHLRVNSCSVYCMSTSIFNFLVMCFGIVPIVSASYSSYDYASYSVPYCKFRSYIVHALFMMSRSSVALACLDRFALCSPNVHIRALSQQRTAIKLVLIASLLWLVIPTHMIVYTNIQMPGRRCGGTGNYSFVYGIYAAAVTAVPLVVMVLFSTLAIRNLKLIRARVQPQPSTVTQNTPQTIRVKKRDVQLVVIVVSQVIIYFVSTILFPVYSIYVAATTNVEKDANRSAIEGFIRYMALSFLLYFNSASTFYVHLVASKAFREECRVLVLRLLQREANPNLLPTAFGISSMKLPASRVPRQMETSFKHQ